MRIAYLRIAARSVRLPALLAILCGGPLTATALGDELPRPPAGEVRLASGRAVDYTIHIDRNSLRDSAQLGDALIALTSSGTLLRFALPGVRWMGERIGVEEVTCLGRGEGEMVLAGLGDGRVCRVDPATLDLTDVAKLPAVPRWLGWARAGVGRSAGVVAVTEETKPREGEGPRRPGWVQHSWAVHDLATGKTRALQEGATAFLLDRPGRLWLGADHGEWGGRVTRVDLATGAVSEVKPPPLAEPGSKASWDGVYGFIELRDGQVWAYGGTSHLGLNSAAITRIDGVEPLSLVAFEPPEEDDKAPDPGRPSRPITHVVEEDDGLLVFAYSDVFRVDKALKSWKKVANLKIQYRWGRPDAMVDLAEPEPPATVHVRVRDGRGRLWLGGPNGLWLVEPGAKAPEAFDRVPWVGRHGVSALAPDPEHADGVIVALGARGVAFVRARPKP